MLNIKILGPGCANCYILEGLAVAAVQFLHSQKPELFENVEVALEHLSTPDDFRRYGVLKTPGLVVNEKLAVAGRLPDVVEVMTLFEKALVSGAVASPPTPAGVER
jgi:hypothetical protein